MKKANPIFYTSTMVLFLGFAYPLIAQQSKMNTEPLRRTITTRLSTVEGKFAVAFKMLDESNQQVLINEKEVFHAASTIKTPVMVEVFDQVKSGKFRLNDSIVIKNEFRSIVDGSPYRMNLSDDSGEGLYELIGQKTTIYQLVYQMITVSSNLATNILIDKVGATSVTNAMKDLGAPNINVLRGVEDQKAFDKGLSNTVTANDLMVLFEKLARKQVVSRQGSEEMLRILADQKFNNIIPAKLPKSVKVAHKTGEITGVRHDSGVVYLPDGRQYVLVLLSKNLKKSDEGVAALADVSEMIYQFAIESK